jgi:hypothetical protein
MPPQINWLKAKMTPRQAKSKKISIGKTLDWARVLSSNAGITGVVGVVYPVCRSTPTTPSTPCLVVNSFTRGRVTRSMVLLDTR